VSGAKRAGDEALETKVRGQPPALGIFDRQGSADDALTPEQETALEGETLREELAGLKPTRHTTVSSARWLG
jgi:hypothetical protein